MVKDAEENAESDKKRREEIDAKNNAEALVNSTEKSLSEHGDKISQDEKKAIEDALKEAKEALEGDDIEAIKSKSESLSTVAMKLGEAMYKAEQEKQASTDGDANNDSDKSADSDVVDAEFSNVKEEDKKEDK